MSAKEDNSVQPMVPENLQETPPSIENAVKSLPSDPTCRVPALRQKDAKQPRTKIVRSLAINALVIMGSLFVFIHQVLTAIRMPFWGKLSGYWKIRRDLALAERLLKERGIHPKRVIAFDRISGIFAGMLAQRLGLGEVILLPRTTTRAPTQDGGRQISVGKGFALTGSDIARRNSLVVVFHVRRGDTLEAATRFFEEQGQPFQGNILAIFATKEGRMRWPGMIIVHLINEGFVPNIEFPWIGGKYNPA